MSTAYFDIETDGLDSTVMHVAVIKPRHGEPIVTRCPSEAVKILNQFTQIVGHNIIGFDAPALEKLSGGKKLTGQMYDTLLMSRVLSPDRYQHPAGGNSLRNWGEFLGFPKGDHDDWSRYSDAMRDYCIQDVEVTQKLFEYLVPLCEECGPAMRLEHQVAMIIRDQVDNGIGFDVDGGERLLSELLVEKTDLTHQLQEIFPPIVEERWSEKTGKRLKDKVTVFNPGSRVQIEQRFRDKYGWKPRSLTETGRAKVDEKVLERLKYPESILLCRYLLVEKRASQVEQWLKYGAGGVIHGQVNTNGAVSGRMSHSKPNVAQVPAVRAEYGERMRELFGPTREGWVQVGADASGLELRMLAHYLARWDNGAYGDVILNGDIHTFNQEKAGLDDRDQAKTFIYATLYGAGATKIGTIVNGGAKEGQILKSNFERALPALKKLKDALAVKVARKSLRGLDGRPLPVRSDHMALNLLLQSAGAVVMKKALVILDRRLQDLHPGQYAFMANIHDEYQLECHPSIVDSVGKEAVDAISQAGSELNLRIKLDGEYKTGSNWAVCH